MPLQEITGEDDRLLQDIADRLVKSHKILIITGAGISTSCGIPDFRSKDGLYNVIPEQNPTPASSVPSTPTKHSLSPDDLPPSSQTSNSSSSSSRAPSTPPSRRLKGQDLFDSSVWKMPQTTQVFYQFIASLRQKVREEVKETSPTHRFIRTLRDGGRLMRCYTQNIDGLERREGLSMDLNDGKGTKKRFAKKIWEAPRPSDARNGDTDGGCEVVPLHGDLEALRCTLCQDLCAWGDEMTGDFLSGVAPECSKCAAKSSDRRERGKRGVAVGTLRPNIVLYGEEHPSNQLLAPLIPFDLSSRPEILVIMGTSLKVHGLQKIVREFSKMIHARKDGRGKVIFVNRTKPAESTWDGVIDSYVAMDCDDWVLDLRRRREDLWLRQGELDLKVTKPVSRKRKCGDGETAPSKRQKVVDQKPSKQRSATSIVEQEDSVRDTQSSILLTPPPSRGKGSFKEGDREPTPRPLIASRKGNFSFKRIMYDNPFSQIFKSPPRPPSSPLRNTWKPSVRADRNGRSPERPHLFSPIATDAKKLRVYQDADAEADIGESQDEEGEEEASAVETPSKVRPLRPSSDSSLNSNTVKEWSKEESKRMPSRATGLAGEQTPSRRKMGVQRIMG